MIKDKKYNYRISFRPLDYYFFGGEETFGNGNQQNYYAKTRQFPQQTTILGVLRHYGHENHVGPGKKAEIGESFRPDCIATKDPFGYIKGISPLFLTYNDQGRLYDYIPSALGKKGKPFDVSKTGNQIQKWGSNAWVDTRQALDYDAKKEWDQVLVSNQPINNDKKYIAFDQVIKTFDKIGITKPGDGFTKKDGFYKQKMAKLEKKWQFSVLADLDEEQVSQLPDESVLPFGAEKALFHISFEKLDDEKNLHDLFPDTLWEHDSPVEDGCILLLSDALVEDSIYEHCTFAITDSLDFRSIYTPKKVTEFGRFNQEKPEGDIKVADRLFKSGKYNLLKRGSLLYGDTAALQKAITRPYCQSIGYNHFTILK